MPAARQHTSERLAGNAMDASVIMRLETSNHATICFQNQRDADAYMIESMDGKTADSQESGVEAYHMNIGTMP